MANITQKLGVTTAFTGFLYDFAVNGGATGTLTTPCYLPMGAKAKVTLTTLTNVTSGGAATIDIKCGGTSLLEVSPCPKADIPLSGNSADLNNVVATTAENQTEALITGGGQVTLVIAGAALTAGKFSVIIETIGVYSI